MLKNESTTEAIIGAAIEVHKVLGPGLLESAYEECLCYELAERKLEFKRQLDLPIRYKNIQLEGGYRMDVLVEGSVLLELKSIESLTAIHEAQLLTYLKLSGLKVGLLINFNVALLKNGLVRRVL